MKMKIADIKLSSSAEVKGHFADVIYFGEDGTEMDTDDIVSNLSTTSDIVVLTGDEPLLQHIPELGKLITRLKFSRKKVVVKTSMYHPLVVGLADKILYTIKTFDINTKDILKLRDMSNVDFCIVVGHRDFDMNGFKFAHSLIRKNIFHRFAMDIPNKFTTLYHYVRSIGKDFPVSRKIEL